MANSADFVILVQVLWVIRMPEIQAMEVKYFMTYLQYESTRVLAQEWKISVREIPDPLPVFPLSKVLVNMGPVYLKLWFSSLWGR